MPKLKIIRIDEFNNKYRKIKIVLDNKVIGTVANAETREFDITEGSHELIAKIDWCSSNRITLMASGSKTETIQLSSFAQRGSLGFFSALYYITFGASRYLNLEQKC